MRDVLARVTVVCAGALWGLYWIPLQRLNAVATVGPWATFFVMVPACLFLAPLAWRGRARIASIPFRRLACIALGGFSFVLYSDGLIYGQVTVVILLFYLTPVWSTLIARYWQHQVVSRLRYVAIVVGIAGIAVVLHAHGGGFPWPRGLGDWFGLLSGLLWAVSSTGIHGRSQIRAVETNFVFCVGALVASLLLAVVFWSEPLPRVSVGAYATMAGWAVLIGVLWWAITLVGFLWAAQILEPALVGILLMSEAVVGAISAGLFAGEPFGMLMMIGTSLVVCAGVIGSVPSRQVSQMTRRV